MSLLCVFMQIYLTRARVHTQNFAQKQIAGESLPPKLHGRSAIMVNNNVQYHQLVFRHNKIDAAPIFTVSRINAEF